MANEAVKIDGAWRILRIAGWGFAAILLLLPAIAMQFTSEVDWDARDFIVMGALIGMVGLGTEFLRPPVRQHRLSHRRRDRDGHCLPHHLGQPRRRDDRLERQSL